MGGNFLASVSLIKETLRVADVRGAIFASSDHTAATDEGNFNASSIIEVLRSPDKLVLVAINNDVTNYSDIWCVEREYGDNSHWVFEDHIVESIAVTIPADMLQLASSLAGSFEVFEVINGEYRSPDVNVVSSFNESAKSWTISSLLLNGQEYVARMFVLQYLSASTHR